MRPASMLQFDRFYLGQLGLALVNSVLSYDESLAMLKADPATAQVSFGSGFIVSVTIFSLGIPLLLWFLISRRASNVAKWALVGITGIGLLMMIQTLPLLMQRSTASLIIVAILTVAQLVAISFLFRGDSKAWFASKGKSIETNSDVFS
jgi:formate-dependent nitrite reductase membrane component NrfD